MPRLSATYPASALTTAEHYDRILMITDELQIEKLFQQLATFIGTKLNLPAREAVGIVARSKVGNRLFEKKMTAETTLEEMEQQLMSEVKMAL